MGILSCLIPIFLISANITYITHSEWLYSYGWWRNDIQERSGLTINQLNRGADQIKDYFLNEEVLLDMKVELFGTEVSLYNEREVLHMVDVKNLMQYVFKVTIATGLGILGITLLCVTMFRTSILNIFIVSIRWSATGCGFFLLIFGATALIDFSWLFTQFHFLSFSNDLWHLDPRTDYLIIMFPQQFFLEASMFIAGLTLIDYLIAHQLVSYTHKKMNP